MSHECFCIDCEVHVPDNMLMCSTHWYKLSPFLRSQIYAAYRAKQQGVSGAAEHHSLLIMEAQKALWPERIKKHVAAKQAEVSALLERDDDHHEDTDNQRHV